MSSQPPIRPVAQGGGSRHPDPRDLPLFAMDLLGPADHAHLAEHLKTCPACLEELGRVFGDLAACALLAEPAPVPAAARQRLLDQVAREKKIVPMPARPATQAPAPTHAQPQAQPAPVLRLSRPAEEEPRPAHWGGGVLGWSGWAIAAGLAVIVGFQRTQHQQLEHRFTTVAAQLERLNLSASRSHQLIDALTDPRAVRVTLTGKPAEYKGPIGGVTYDAQKGSLVFLASDLDPLKQYKTYELWIIPADGGTPIPSGTFHPDDRGNASVIMPDLPRGVEAKAFGVTIEDNGGAQTPTLPIVLAGS